MSTINETGAVSGSSTTSELPSALKQLSPEDFLRVLMTEMANQDPMEPMSNTDLLQQLAHVQSLTLTGEMSDGFQAMLAAQELSQASSLVGKTVTGTDSTGKTVTGVVDAVRIAGDRIDLAIGESTVPVGNVTEILAAGSGNTALLLPGIDTQETLP